MKVWKRRSPTVQANKKEDGGRAGKKDTRLRKVQVTSAVSAIARATRDFGGISRLLA